MEKQIYMNRELSWLKFNERVLEEAESDETPLCERLTFAFIYQSNLDEFFMVRVGALIDQMMLPKEIKDNKTNMTSKEQINEILTQVAKLNYRKDIVYENLMKMVEEHGIRLVNFRKIDKEKGEYLERYFDAEILPMLSATIVGKRQPFPFLRNKEIYAAAVLTRKNGKEKIGLIPCTSGVFRRLIPVPGSEGTFMLSEELILHFMAKAFPGYTIKEKSLIRVTRNADIDADALYDEDLDYRDFMADLIKRRKHLAPVKMELSREFDGEVVKQLCEYLDMKPEYVFRSNTPLDLSFFFQIQDMLRQNTGLFYNRRVPQKSSSFEKETDVLAQIKEKDRLLSYPYESIKPFLQMLREAANDPKVVS
ncbi:MAG: polyphosphate kinase 1, partial [Muricoprocola sp.]